MPVRVKFLVFILGLLASGWTARPIGAATASASISVSATVQASCLAAVNATMPGIYSAPADPASMVSVACSNSAPYMVTLSAPSTNAVTGGLRETARSGFVLLRNPLSPYIRGISNWGQSTSTNRLAGLGSGSSSLLAIHDRISAAQCATPGTHADTMIVVVTY